MIDKYIALLPDLNLLDETLFNDLIEFNLRTDGEARISLDATISLLKRLPKVPIEFHEYKIDPPYPDIDEIYFSNITTRSWETLRAASFVSTAVLSLALTTPSTDEEGKRFPITYVSTDLCKTIPRLLDVLIRRSRESAQTPLPLFILRTYLWGVWQRAMMLRNNDMLGNIVTTGFGGHDYHFQGRESHYRFLEIAFERSLLSKDHNNGNGLRTIPYICRWAYVLFKSNSNALTMDFRHLFHRFGEVFGTRPARCNRLDDGTFQTCDGSSPLSCQRFFGMKIKDQSAHATYCNGNCRRLYRDEVSYRGVDGGRAVSVTPQLKAYFQYCPTSSTTKAISHVWSHGQGGRPEKGGTGLNECLYERYTKIALDNAVDSY